MKHQHQPRSIGRVRARASMQSMDGFQNLLLRLGEGSTVMAGARYNQSGFSWDNKRLEALYRTSWIVGQVVDVIAEDMTRAGVDITGMDSEDSAKLQRQMTRKQHWVKLTETIKWARLYGGAIAVINIEGQDFASPLRTDTIAKGKFSGLMVFDRWSANPSVTDLVKEGNNLGDPEFYEVSRLGLKIHHSRVLRFIGAKLPWNQAEREQGWGMSVIERLFDRLVPFDSATAGAAQLMTKAHLRTVGVENLREILTQGGIAEENLIKMFSLMSKMQNNEGVTLIDKADDFQATSYTFAGVSDIITQFGQQLSGASGIPLVRLFGQSPAGLSSTGESDMRNYYDNISQKQENDLRHPLLRVIEIEHISTFGKPPEDDLDFSFNPLKQPDSKEKAETAKSMTESVTSAYAEELINRATAMRELKHVGEVTGIFNNISEEDIDKAEKEDEEADKKPPIPPGMIDPETGLPVAPAPAPGQPPAAAPAAPAANVVQMPKPAVAQ